MNLKDIVVLSESPEDEALLDKAESAYVQVRATTKNIKYDDTAIEILSKVGTIVDDLDVEEVKDEIEYLERALFDAKNNLESAVYELEAPFEDLIRTLKNKIDDEEADREWEERYGTDESILSNMTKPLGEDREFEYEKAVSPFQNFENWAKIHGRPHNPKSWNYFKSMYDKFIDLDEASMLNPAIDAEFINWLKDKGKDTLFPYTLADMNNPTTLEQMKQLYYKETGQLAGDGGTLKYGAPGSDRRNAFSEDEEKMIGKPDDYYDAEERTNAYKELQDVLQGNYMDDYIKNGDCPACGGTGYMDGEETFTNDDGEEEESSECDGFGNYGCDEGEMTYGSDGPSWVEIMKHDERRKERAELAAKPQPSDDVLFKAAKLLHKEYVMDTGRYNAFELPQLLRQMYPEIPKHKAREIGSQVLNDYKAENKINSDMALTTEGKKSDDAVNTLVNMFYDMLDEFSSEEELEAEVESQAQSLTRVYGDFDTQKATERALADLSDNSDYPGSIDRDYDARNEGVLEGNMTLTDFVKQAKQSQKLNVIRDKELILKAYELFSKGVANTPGEAVNMAQAHMDNMAYEGKSPHKKGTKKYKKHMAAMHAGEGITTGPTKNNVRITELSPARDNSANEQKVAELIRKSLKDPQGQDAFELYAELESTNPELAELYKDVALNQYEVNLEEGIKDTLKKGAVTAGVIGMLLGINALGPTAKDGELGQALNAHVQSGGEDADLAKYYYKALDFYADQSDERTLINLNIKFNPKFKTNRVSYDPNRQDVEIFLRKQAKLPEPTNERKLKDVEADDIVTVKIAGIDREFIRKGNMWHSTDPKYQMQYKVGSPTHDKLLNIQRKKQMRRSTPSAQAKRFGESWSPKEAGKKYWWE